MRRVRAELEESDRFADVTQMTDTKIGDIGQPRGGAVGLGDQHLAVMTGRFHPRRRVDHRSEVITAPLFRLAEVQPRTHLSNMPSQLELPRATCASVAACTASDARPNAAANESPAVMNT